MSNNPNIRRIVLCLTVILAGFSTSYAQSNKTPEGRVKNFYSWYLRSIDEGHDPAKNRTVMNSHLSARPSRWYYSKAGQNLDADFFVSSQEWSEEWAGNVNCWRDRDQTCDRDSEYNTRANVG